MGRKGDSKRKDKKTIPVSKANVIGSSNLHSADRDSAQNVVEEKGSAPGHSKTNPSAGSKKGH